MADNPKLDSASCPCATGGLEENFVTQKISVLDQINGLQYTNDKSDSFVIDMENFSHGTNINNPNSRITLQRSLSRKGCSRGGGDGGGGAEKKVNSNLSPNDRDTNTNVAASSPKGSSMPEKALLLPAGTTTTTNYHSSNTQVHHHQITINTTTNMNVSSESRCTIRRNSFKRPPYSWTIDPKRVLFFFATLSSMGTILLIYFTLSIVKLGADDSALD